MNLIIVRGPWGPQGLLVWLSYTQRDLGTALQKKEPDAYYAAIRHFLGVVVIAAPLFAYYR